MTVSRDIAAPRQRVWDVLADGWTYSGWVVGNSHVRGVDPGWPSVGTRIHHSAGAWPVQIELTIPMAANSAPLTFHITSSPVVE